MDFGSIVAILGALGLIAAAIEGAERIANGAKWVASGARKIASAVTGRTAPPTLIEPDRPYDATSDASALTASSDDGLHRPLIQSNLPNPNYLTYVERTSIQEAVESALSGHLPIVCLVGVSGRGKTTIAHRIASRALSGGLLDFQTVVWISDEELPGTTSLENIFEALGLVTGNPGMTRGEMKSRIAAANKQLSEISTLLVINNFETIRDPNIVEWLATMPRQSRALLTSTVSPTPLDRQMVEVDVDRPGDDLATAFFAGLLAQRAIPGLDSESDQLQRLWQAADGNFKLVERAVGLLRKRPLDSVLRVIGTADDPGLDLLRAGWDSLASEATQVLS